MTELEQMTSVVRDLSAAVSNALLYSPEHPQVTLYAGQAAEKLRLITKKTGEAKLIVVDDVLFLDQIPLERNLFGSKLVQAMKGRGIGFLLFMEGVDKEDILRITSVLCGRTGEISPPEHVRFGKVGLETEGGVGDIELASFEQIPEEQLRHLAETYEKAGRKEKVTLSSLAATIAGFLNAFRKAANPLLALAPLRAMDEYSFAHSVNVGILNMAQAMSLGMEGQLLHDAGMAGMLHDVGKLHIGKEILQKPGELSEAEREELRQHPVRGAEYLLNQPGIPRLAVLAAFEHHLGHDLSGYPQVSSTWKPSLVSEITAISDCFDAMRTKRVYQDPSDFEKTAGKLLEFAGTSLHPALTLNFLRVLSGMGAT